MYQIYDHMDNFIWDRWVEHLIKTEGDGSEESRKHIIEMTPTCCCYHMNFTKGTITISWGVDEDDNESSSQTLPLTIFYDDEDNQPDLKMLWHSDYYDHPLTGMALYNGKKVWFKVGKEDDLGEERYDLLQLTPELLEELERRHKMFQEMVGYHCDHDPEVYKPFTMNQKTFDEYYDTKKERLDLSECEVIATVEWFQFKHWSRPH